VDREAALTIGWLAAQISSVDVGCELTFDAVRARGAFAASLALIVAVFLDRAADWEVWAIAPDGRRFMVRDGLDEGTAVYMVDVFDGEVRQAGSPEEWARSKGFDTLALHLQSGVR